MARSIATARPIVAVSRRDDASVAISDLSLAIGDDVAPALEETGGDSFDDGAPPSPVMINEDGSPVFPTRPPEPPPPNPPSDPAGDLRRRLVAIVAEPDGQLAAVLAPGVDGRRRLRVGDPFEDGWTLIGLSRQEGILKHGERVLHVPFFGGAVTGLDANDR